MEDPIPFFEMPSSGNIIEDILQLTSPNFHRKVYAISQKLGGICKIPAPPPYGTVVAVTDPRILKEVTAVEFTGVTKPPTLYKTFAELCSDAKPDPQYPVLATDNEQQWGTIRDGFKKAFAKEAVVQYLPTLDDEASKVLRQVTPGDVDILELVGRISLSTTGHVMFGYDAFQCTDLEQPPSFWKEVIAARKGAVDAARSPLTKVERHLLPHSADSEAFTTNIQAVYRKYEEISNHLNISYESSHDTSTIEGALPTILGAFNTTRDPFSPTEPMSKEDTIATIGNFVVAGTLPAATAAAYTLCHISCHAEVQSKVYAELDAAGLGYGKRGFTADDVDKLPYLSNVIKEAMRVNPTVPQVNRKTTKDLVLGGYQVPAGTLIFLSMGGMHTSPFNFTQPSTFWPDRWSTPATDGISDNNHPQACPMGNRNDLDGSFSPFSQGSRSCLGQNWARLAILATVASVMSRFELLSPRSMSAESLAAGEIFSVSCYPKEPLVLTIKPREQETAVAAARQE